MLHVMEYWYSHTIMDHIYLQIENKNVKGATVMHHNRTLPMLEILCSASFEPENYRKIMKSMDITKIANLVDVINIFPTFQFNDSTNTCQVMKLLFI